MSKEPAKREDLPKPGQEQAPAADKLEERRREGKILETDEGPYHGYTRQQVERMEAERDPPDPVPTEASAAVQPNPEPELALEPKKVDKDEDDREKGKRR
jgi:hypothetical protein